MVGSRHRAIEQQQPRRLRVGHLLHAVPKARLDREAVVEEALHELRTADWRPENDDAVLVRGEIPFPNRLGGSRRAAQERVYTRWFRTTAPAPDFELPELRLHPGVRVDALRDHPCDLRRSFL